MKTAGGLIQLAGNKCHPWGCKKKAHTNTRANAMPKSEAGYVDPFNFSDQRPFWMGMEMP